MRTYLVRTLAVVHNLEAAKFLEVARHRGDDLHIPPLALHHQHLESRTDARDAGECRDALARAQAASEQPQRLHIAHRGDELRSLERTSEAIDAQRKRFWGDRNLRRDEDGRGDDLEVRGLSAVVVEVSVGKCALRDSPASGRLVLARGERALAMDIEVFHCGGYGPSARLCVRGCEDVSEYVCRGVDGERVEVLRDGERERLREGVGRMDPHCRPHPRPQVSVNASSNGTGPVKLLELLEVNEVDGLHMREIDGLWMWMYVRPAADVEHRQLGDWKRTVVKFLCSIAMKHTHFESQRAEVRQGMYEAELLDFDVHFDKRKG